MSEAKESSSTRLTDSQTKALAEQLDVVAQVHELQAKLARVNKQLLEAGISRPKAFSTFVVGACW